MGLPYSDCRGILHVGIEDVQGAVTIEVALGDRDRTPTGEADVGRSGTVRGRPITQLAGAIGAPALHGHVVEHCARVGTSMCDGEDRAACIEGDAHGSVAGRGGSVTELAVAVAAPALE